MLANTLKLAWCNLKAGGWYSVLNVGAGRGAGVAAATVGIALLTVGLQSLKAALMNLVNALRSK